MTSLTGVQTESRPISPEPISDEEAAAGIRAAINIFRNWGVTDEQASILLDTSTQTFACWKKGSLSHLGQDTKTRLAIIMGIHKALRTIFQEPARGYRWIKASNAAFDDRSALDVMLGGEITDLTRLRRYLDAVTPPP